jgi:hypothetical protein
MPAGMTMGAGASMVWAGGLVALVTLASCGRKPDTPPPSSNVQIAASIQVRKYETGGYVIHIGEEAMLGLMPVFEQERSYSNGPAWGALIEYVVSSDPRLSDYKLDPEGLGWSKTKEPLDRLRSILLEAAADPSKLRKLIRDGRAAGFGHGDL